MSTRTTSILTTLLLSAALTIPAGAKPQQRYPFLGRLLSTHGAHNAQRTGGKSPLAPRKGASAPVNTDLISYDEPDAAGGTSGLGINNEGFAVGEFGGSDGHSHGFLRAPDGSFTEINVGTNPSSAFWINDKGAIIGDYFKGGIVRPYLRQANGKIVRIDLPDSQYADGLDVNNKGVATGDFVDSNGLWHGFIRAKDGSLTTFEEPNAATGSDMGTFAGATNIHGDTIGPYIDGDGVLHGYIRHANNTFTEFDVDGAVDTIPYNENAKGWVVGFFDDENGVTHGFIRKPNGRIIVVDVAGAGTDPGQGTVVQDISDNEIAVGNYVDADNVSHGFTFSVSDATTTTFDGPGAGPIGTIPISINTSGEVSGSVYDENDDQHGLIGTP
jgi:hypothetical protein